jgi:hypothetical protein
MSCSVISMMLEDDEMKFLQENSRLADRSFSSLHLIT